MVNKIDAQKWLNEHYNDKSIRKITYPNKIEVNEDETVEIKTNEFKEPLKGEELIIDDYPRLKEIKIIPSERRSWLSFLNKQEIKKIVISNCPELTKIVIKEAGCEELVLKDIPKLQYLNVKNNKLSKLNVKEQKKLIHLNTKGNPITKPLFVFLDREQNYSVGNSVRKILLVGRTGSGKSTLANVLSGTNNFKESGSAVSQTARGDAEEFEVEVNTKHFEKEKIKYKVIDTIGLGDTRFNHHQVLEKIENTCQEVKNGLHQVFFITRGRFTAEEWETFKVLKKIVFNEEIGNYTTIVRTDFADFENEEKCLEEIKRMTEESSEFSQLLKECGDKLIFVNNPSAEISGGSKRAEMQNALNKELREASRNKLLKHLMFSFTNYQPSNLDSLGERINNYKTDKERLDKKLENFKQLSEIKQREVEREIRRLEAKVEQQAKELSSKLCIIS